MLFKGKTAIVTGASRGIGREIARAFAMEGANVLIQDLQGAHDTAVSLRQDGLSVTAVEGDVSQKKDMLLMVEIAKDNFQGIDILVNNAGIFSSLLPKKIEDVSVEEWDRVVAVNARGVFLSTQSVIASMRKRGGGKIVNIASNSALGGLPNFIHYVASKGAVVSMTKSLAKELGQDNILVNAVAPGYTLSDGTLANQEQIDLVREGANSRRALKRDQIPEDVIGAILFLASEKSSFMTGQILCVDGGTYM